MAIFAYMPFEKDFTTNGIGKLFPADGEATETANGEYELRLSHPINDAFEKQSEKWRKIQRGAIISIEVPLRTMPEIIDANGSPKVVTDLEQWRVVVESTTIRNNAFHSSAALFTLSEEAKWIVTEKQGNWYRGRDDRGRSGWAYALELEYEKDIVTTSGTGGIEMAVPSVFSRQQFFRVYRPAWTLKEVTIYARHISYDFSKNLVAECALEFVDGYTAMRAMMNNLYITPTEFECYTDISARPGVNTDKKSINWTRFNPIKALLDPDEGFAEKYNAELVRDNHRIYMLRDAGMDRGYQIVQGNNMLGITWDENEEEVVTKILPVGQSENGQALLLPEMFITSAHVGDYPTVNCSVLDVPEAAIGSENESGEVITEEMAYQMMRDAANAEFENGADLPIITLRVDFINLGDTEEFKQFRGLRQLYMHDTIRIVHKTTGKEISAKVVGTTWNPITKRYTGIEISNKHVDRTKSKVASWQIPGGVEGTKIRAGTIGAAQLSPGLAETAIDSLPVGTWLPFSGSIPPSNKWMFAEGQALPQDEYPEARAIFGEQLPDMRGRTLVHMDAAQMEFNNLHKQGGSKTHAHELTSEGGNLIQLAEGTIVLSEETGQASSLQPYTTIRYIIKALP